MTNQIAATYSQLTTCLTGIGMSRSRFQAFFEDWLLDDPPLEEAQRPTNFIHAVWTGYRATHALTPRPRPEETSDAVRLALAALGTEEATFDCVVAAIAAGLFDPEVATQGVASWRKSLSAIVLEAFGGGTSRAVRQAISTREVLTDTLDFWTDLGHILPAITLARRRLCRIEVADENSLAIIAKGTGFLIGPSKVLTNLHVVKTLPDSLPDPILPDGRKDPTFRRAMVQLRFDHSETTGRKDDAASTYHVTESWCLAKGGLGDDSHEGPDEDYWWDSGAKRLAWLGLVADTLDYAVIEIDGTPGMQRGWYDLSVEPQMEPTGVWALHHPTIDDQTITRGTVPISAGLGRQRLFHGASTTVGSSGGLILNEIGEPAALHYMGLKVKKAPDPAQTWQKNERINVAIPLDHVARDLEARGLLGKLQEVSAIRPYRGCLDGRRPVFGRADFLNKLHDFWTSDKRILRVDIADETLKGRRPGKSFSGDILAGLFKGPEHHHIHFSAVDIKVDALRVAKAALGTFAEDLVPRIPTDPDTTSPAYVRRLVGFFAKAMRDRLPNHNVWIVIDDLDQYDLSDASGREFLATLYNQIGRMPSLRILLIGLPAGVSISGMKDEDMEVTPITAKEINNLGQLLTDWLKERGAKDANITDEGFELIEKMLLSYAGEAAPLARMAEFAEAHLSDAAEAMFGSALDPDANPPGPGT